MRKDMQVNSFDKMILKTLYSRADTCLLLFARHKQRIPKILIYAPGHTQKVLSKWFVTRVFILDYNEQ